MNQCRMIHSLLEQRDSGPVIISETEYIWDGDRVDFTVVSEGEEIGEGYQRYNNQGFLVESYLDYGKKLQKKETIDYDCAEEWCWRKREHTTNLSYGEESIVELAYEWSGKTESYLLLQGESGSYGVGGNKGKVTYNEYFNPVKSIHHFKAGYSEETTSYDCKEGWCKPQLQKGRFVFIEQRPELFLPKNLSDVKLLLKEQLRERENISEQEYENDWEENRLDWKKGEWQGHTIYNEYGYPIEEFSEYLGLGSLTKNTYDCGDKE